MQLHGSSHNQRKTCIHSTILKLHSMHRKALEDAIQKHLDNQKEALMHIAHISTLAGIQTSYGMSCKPQLQNTLVHAKVKEVNMGE